MMRHRTAGRDKSNHQEGFAFSCHTITQSPARRFKNGKMDFRCGMRSTRGKGNGEQRAFCLELCFLLYLLLLGFMHMAFTAALRLQWENGIKAFGEGGG
jgi:hypothetical protein